MFLQIYAAYNRNQKLIIVLAVICVLSHIASLVMAIILLPVGERLTRKKIHHRAHSYRLHSYGITSDCSFNRMLR